MWDLKKTVNHLNANAKPTTTYWCAKYVRQAIEAGGLTLQRASEARQYGPSLLSAGFVEVPLPGMPHQTGDVVIIQGTSTVKEGHMAMFNGSIWVSDYRQTASIYPGGSFDRERPRYNIFRYSKLVSAPPQAAGMKHRDAILAEAKRQNVRQSTIDEYFKFMEHGQGRGQGLGSRLAVWLGGADVAEHAVKLAKFFFMLRAWGFSVADIAAVFTIIVGIRAPRALVLIDHVLKNGSRFETILKKSGNVRAGLALFVTFIQVYNHLADEEYGPAAAASYRGLLGSKIPWAGAIDALQSMMPKNTRENSTVFKVLKACDPIGLGAAGIDSLVFGVQVIIDRVRGKSFNDKRLADLVTRLKQGPTAIFAEFGEKIPIGEIIFEISDMKSSDWKKLGQRKATELAQYLRSFGSKR